MKIRDCRACPVFTSKPEVLPGNLRAWELYQLVGTQVRVAGMGEVIGLDHTAVLAVFALYDLKGEEAIDIFEKLIVLHGLFMQDQRKKSTERETHEKRLAALPEEDRQHRIVKSN